MTKFGLLLGVLVVGVVLIIVGLSGTSDGQGASPTKPAQEAKGSVNVGLLLGGIGVCLLSVLGMVLMFRAWINKPSDAKPQPAPAPAPEKKPEEKSSQE